MGQFVNENEITRADKRRDDADIGEIPRTKDAGCRRVLQSREARFELAQQRMIAGHETRSAGAHAIDPQCFNGGGLNHRVMGQIEVIVARER